MGGIGSGRVKSLTENHITVSRIKKVNGRSIIIIYSCNKMFWNEYLTLSIIEDCIKISFPIIGERLKKHKTRVKKGYPYLRMITFLDEHNIPNGRYDIDQDDSDDDELWVYLSQNEDYEQ